MAINTTADIQNGEYGIWKTTGGKAKFYSFGNATFIEEICEDIETGGFFMKLCCEYQGKTRRACVDRGETIDFATIKTLASKGFQVSKKSFNAFVDVLQLQEEELQNDGVVPTKVYSHLGWKDVSNDSGGVDKSYRSFELIGKQSGEYVGSYDIEPVGSYKKWKEMVVDDVVGHPVLELVLIASLAAVINGLIAPATNGENPIVHLNYGSGKGKSTAGFLAASTAGRPFDGVIVKNDKYGMPKEYHSIYQSWGATDNAMITTQAGNCGVVTVLNELGKNFSKNMTRLIFDLSEGSDKKRLTSTLNTRVSERYVTVFISTGESSLLDKCKTKLEGLSIRVMEISKPITDNAEHANRIKETCRENCGFAAPKLAKYIIEHGGVDFLLPIYKKWMTVLRDEMPESPNKDRFVEKFAALFMTTADVATEALKIKFDKDGIKKFLFEYDKEHGAERNVALQSYEKIVEICNVNRNRFFKKSLKRAFPKDDGIYAAPSNECWGRISETDYTLIDGRKVIEEIEVYPDAVDRILADNGFPNKDTCIQAWKEAHVIDYEDTKNYRKRKIDPRSNEQKRVFVFRIFEDTSQEKEANDIDNSKKEKIIKKSKAKSNIIKKPTAAMLRVMNISEDDEEDSNDEILNPA